MSLPRFAVSCVRCDYRQEVDDFSVGNYRLAGGVSWTVESELAWCKRCGFTHRERLPTLEEIQKRRVDAESMPRVLIDEVTGLEITRASTLGKLDVVRAWVASRKAAPRCLQCGGCDATRCDGELLDGTCFHPSCGGKIRVDEWSMVLPRESVFTAEGERIPEPSGGPLSPE